MIDWWTHCHNVLPSCCHFWINYMAPLMLVPYREKNVFMWNLIQLQHLEYMSVEGHCIIYRFTFLFSATIKGSAVEGVTWWASLPQCKKLTVYKWLWGLQWQTQVILKVRGMGVQCQSSKAAIQQVFSVLQGGKSLHHEGKWDFRWKSWHP